MRTDKKLWRNRKARKDLARRLQLENLGLRRAHHNGVLPPRLAIAILRGRAQQSLTAVGVGDICLQGGGDVHVGPPTGVHKGAGFEDDPVRPLRQVGPHVARQENGPAIGVGAPRFRVQFALKCGVLPAPRYRDSRQGPSLLVKELQAPFGSGRSGVGHRQFDGGCRQKQRDQLSILRGHGAYPRETTNLSKEQSLLTQGFRPLLR
jgi:hypothetical protein